jgi:hypothetical protein
MACYNGPNPIKDEERAVIWKWAKENAIDRGMPIEKVGDSINQYFFAGHAKPEWITDILSGRKTPFRDLTNDAWKKQYNRRVIVQQAQDMSRLANMGPLRKTLSAIWSIPRGVATMGHGFVFPVTHGGDLIMRPASWGTFIKGFLNTYQGAFSKSFTARMLSEMESRPLYDTALRSGLDVGAKSLPSGILGKGAHGPAMRAWNMLTTMRYELWERQMKKFISPDMSQEEVLDIGKNLASWANHATGSGKGPIANLGGDLLFGPKLTQSKLNRLTVDPAQTINTFANWSKATPGEKAVAWTRLSGATQYLAAGVGFLAVNQGLLMALGSKEKVNFTDPTKADFLAFKGGGIEGYVPGLHTEIKTLGKILATAFMSNKELRGESRQAHAGEILGQYAMAKTNPIFQRGQEVLFRQNWEGRPTPWSETQGTEKKPKMSWGEYAGSVGPIPLQGPIGYVYNKLKEGGASAMDASAIVKGLILSGVGATGVHIHEEHAPSEPKAKKARNATWGASH